MGLLGGVRLGSIVGIEILIDWSLLVIFLLITFSLALGVFPAWHPDWSTVLAWTTALAAATLFFASVLLHELSHAVVGRAKGIEIRRLTLFIFGGMAHMESEPPTWRAEFWMAIVGPLTSLALGVVFIWMAGLVAGPLDVDPANPQATLSTLGPVASLLLWLGPVNLLLAVFNMVPGFPLDGGRVLRALVWGATGDLRLATRWATGAGQGFAMLAMAAGLAMIFGVQLPVFGSGMISGLWLVFIGWFLNTVAQLSYRQMLLRDSLADVPVRLLMQTRFARVDPLLRIRTLVDEQVMPSGQRAFPVESDGLFLGIVCLRDLRKCPSKDWGTTTVAEVMTPAAALVTVASDQSAFTALELLGQRDLNQLPVLEGDRLVGLLRREDVVRWLSLQPGANTTQVQAQRHPGLSG